ncbi:bifunctional 2-keto-4-hydroxyglutarate aldolase/2-keto-3-deoxy-6-phosphogluconate aldolase [Enterococcus canintestini]|uniref:bifunctional 2-keto-4-hydroxyglutarate aldolase/2-keto-3-deoxy-6-phosphogluconate aldolase n=1 Tax=Enterococcus canintestini TaxID=317010 RepID=UPI00288FB405|nr:bifunctional 2-keto-4-hydroxyglutarate aldolase/2-keto-3-deoxy-6-phosphogluconate aldolase [Enterococcus canintestini]MDT2738346.1 bifunctional 2-keto-4-hydroxyglutarate aldolase/2-keto-3-deoxy-6-phosphogluconate aldolase [Enterococcus canintestini]
MKKGEVLARLEKTGIVAVIREETTQQALNAAQAVVAGGILGLEVTFSVPNAAAVITQLKEIYPVKSGVVIGAGTVLDATTARLAIMAGAEFIVSPTFNKETAQICNLYQIPYLPGCMTITEMQQALMSGAEIVKLFPANNFEPTLIKSIKAPLPQISIMPTGGINLDNLAAWKNAGALLVGVGGNLFQGVAENDYAQVTKTAALYSKKWQQI